MATATMTMKLLMLLIVAGAYCASAQQAFQCPKECKCAGYSLDCSHKGLTVVPRNLPTLTERLDLQGNNLSVVHRNDFAGLGNLRILQLLENQITSIERGSFDDLVNLERLRLNNNRLRSLPDSIFVHMPKLYRLDISYNRLQIVGKKTLRGIPRLKNLQMDNNQLRCIDDSALRNMKDMEILTLNDNNITTLAKDVFVQLHKLRTMRIADNALECDCHLAWLAKWLRINPRLALFTKCASPRHLRNVEVAALKESDFKCNGVEELRNMDCMLEVMCPAKCMCAEGIVDCRDRGLTAIPDNIPEETMEVRLEQNMITSIPPKSFAEFKRLRRIDLSNNQITGLAPDAFFGLKNLNSLVLYGNKITELPQGVFDGLTSLQLLLLNANKITCIRRDAFRQLSSLNLLSLYDNSIQSLANETFTPLRRLQTIHLARNPFICDCNLRWLSEYLHSNPIETSGARCESPRRMQRKRIGQMKDSKFKCKGSEEYRTKNADQCLIDMECPPSCVCEGTIVDCSNRKLRAVPEDIPMFTTDLRLNDNLIRRIEKTGVFKELPNLQKIDLSNNEIEEIAKDAFEGAGTVTDLLLTENKLKQLDAGAFNGLVNLQTLMLRTNKLSCIKRGTFANLTEMRLLSLYDNQIRCIELGAFDNMLYLSTLNLLFNPFNCNCHLSWLPEWLRQRHIVTGNPRCESPRELKDMPLKEIFMQNLTCSRNMENACAPESSCPAGCSCVGTVVRCSRASLTHFPEDIPLATTELYLDGNLLDAIPGYAGSLKNLVRIDLSNNLLGRIPDNCFTNLTKLQTLILSFNKLQCISPTSFAGLRSLRILSLHRNDISLIPEGAFDDLVALTHIALGDNTLWCDCRLSWLSELIKKRFLEPGIASCSGPASMTDKHLLTTPTRDFSCAGDATNATVMAKCDICWTFPCKNNATCRRRGLDSYECKCTPGYHGDQCENVIDACYGNPCENNGLCNVLEQGRFSCQCPGGFEGDRCETNIDDCVGNNCENNSTCRDLVVDYECVCTPGYTGQFCSDRIDYCSESFNPCENGATCVNLDTDYRCVCLSGYTGVNCSVNINDCEGHSCQNGATCVDGLSAYTCECADGFAGTYCEISLVVPMIDSMASICEKEDCQNGVCYKKEATEGYQCKCTPGFEGKACDTLRSVTFKGKNSHAEFPPLNLNPSVNVTVVFATSEENGVIVYMGDQSHIAAELFRGRIRISYDVGNYPVSTMFSYEQVSDGKYHTVELISNGKNFTLRIDGGQARTIMNEGERDYAEISTPLFFGGLPESAQARALSQWHIRNGSSFHGCVKRVFINGEPRDFLKATNQHLMAPGCPLHDGGGPCERNKCSNGGTCVVSGDNMEYTCKCKRGYGGKFCDIGPTCHKDQVKQYHQENDCKSTKKVKLAECKGSCGNGCCKPVKSKLRRVRMACTNGTRYTKRLQVIRKCGCQDCTN